MTLEKVIYGYLASDERFPKGAVIIEEGSQGDWVCVVMEGRVKVRKRTAKGMLTIDTLKEGDIFGEMALFGKGGGIRTASVQADTDVKIGILDTGRLVRDYETLSPQLRSLLVALIKRLKMVTDRVITLAVEKE